MESREGSDQALHLPGGSQTHPAIVALSAGFPGVSAVLENGARLGLWQFVRLEGERVSIPQADVTLLGAWHPQYESLLNLGGKIGVVWTSSIGEMEFTPVEWQYLEGLLQDPRISFVWFGQKELADLFPQKGFHAPYPLAPLASLSVEKKPIITLFCPAGPKKNISNQVAAVALVQRERPDLVLHTNVQAATPLLDFLGVKYVMHPWLPADEYHKLLASARVNLAASWCETHSYQAAEALALGTVSVISETIPLPGVLVSNPNSPSLIADGILTAIELPADELAAARQALEQTAAHRNQELAQALARL